MRWCENASATASRRACSRCSPYRPPQRAGPHSFSTFLAATFAAIFLTCFAVKVAPYAVPPTSEAPRTSASTVATSRERAVDIGCPGVRATVSTDMDRAPTDMFGEPGWTHIRELMVPPAVIAIVWTGSDEILGGTSGVAAAGGTPTSPAMTLTYRCRRPRSTAVVVPPVRRRRSWWRTPERCTYCRARGPR